MTNTFFFFFTYSNCVFWIINDSNNLSEFAFIIYLLFNIYFLNFILLIYFSKKILKGRLSSNWTVLRMNVIYLNNCATHNSFASSTVNSAEKSSRISSSAPQIYQLPISLSQAALMLSLLAAQMSISAINCFLSERIQKEGEWKKERFSEKQVKMISAGLQS